MQTLQNKLSSPNMTHYPFECGQGETSLVNLQHLCAYRISGQDATEFLQGQFTNDVTQITDQRAQLSAYCTPKGRMLATFYLCRWQEDYILICCADIGESFIQRLSMYIMRAKVKIEQITDELILGVIDPDQHLASKFSLLKSLKVVSDNLEHSNYRATCTDEMMCFRVPGPDHRYVLLCRSSDSNEIFEALNEIKQVYPESVWIQMDIMSGTPWINSNTQELFVPQMANMELIEGVSFSKGCYPGQEVVARLHYLGNANRRMFQFFCITEQLLAAGDDILSTESQQTVGKILNVEKVDQHKWIGLAVMRIDHIQDDNLHCHDHQITMTSLPYNVPIEGKNK